MIAEPCRERSKRSLGGLVEAVVVVLNDMLWVDFGATVVIMVGLPAVGAAHGTTVALTTSGLGTILLGVE